MRKILFILSAFVLLIHNGCHAPKQTAEASENEEYNYLHFSDSFLKCMDEGRLNDAANFIHPKQGVRFSPYAYIDSSALILTNRGFSNYLNSDTALLWGWYDGSGDSMLLSLTQYIEHFLYNVPFYHAEYTRVDSFMAHGNSLNNLTEFYPGKHFTEYYFKGFDPKYGGMDWQCIRLVFDVHENKLYLIAIVNDRWTI